MRKALKALRSRVGRLYREVTRKLHELPEQARGKARDLLHRVARILNQRIKESKTSASCMRCTRRKSNVFPREKPGRPMSLASK